jgi:hypothetical protein
MGMKWDFVRTQFPRHSENDIDPLAMGIFQEVGVELSQWQFGVI